MDDRTPLDAKALAALLGVCERTAYRRLADLRAVGAVEVIDTPREGMRRRRRTAVRLDVPRAA